MKYLRGKRQLWITNFSCACGNRWTGSVTSYAIWDTAKSAPSGWADDGGVTIHSRSEPQHLRCYECVNSEEELARRKLERNIYLPTEVGPLAKAAPTQTLRLEDLEL